VPFRFNLRRYTEDEEEAGGAGAGKSTARVGSRLSALRPAWLPTKDQVLGRGKVRDVYEDAAAAAGRTYVSANVHWISIDPVHRSRIVTAIALFFCIVAASRARPTLAAISGSSFGESVVDFFDAPHPAYPTTDKLWRKEIRRSKAARENASPCGEDLISAQHEVWLHNTCHFQAPPAAATDEMAKFTTGADAKSAHRGAMIDAAITEYIAVRRTQDAEVGGLYKLNLVYP
jgi:hypothetical protein